MFSGHVVQKNRSRKKFEPSALFITHLGTNQVRSSIYIMITILIRRQAKVKHSDIPEWVTISFSREPSQLRGGTWVSCIGRCIFFYHHWATREVYVTVCVNISVLWRESTICHWAGLHSTGELSICPLNYQINVLCLLFQLTRKRKLLKRNIWTNITQDHRHLVSLSLDAKLKSTVHISNFM